MRHVVSFLVFSASVLLCSCALPPKKLQGNFADISPNQATTNQFVGASVRWGGIVTGERLTDSGYCLEVAWYPLDHLTLHPVSEQRRSVIATRPRFLACGGLPDKGDIDQSNGTVTAIGIVRAANVYEVNLSFCVANSKNRYPVYSGTIHANNDDACVVSLPVLEVIAIHAWPIPPSNSKPFRAACTFCT